MEMVAHMGTSNSAQYSILSMMLCFEAGLATTWCVFPLGKGSACIVNEFAHEKQMSMVAIAMASPSASFSRGRMP